MVAVADYDLLGSRLPGAVEACLRGGISWICLRAKNADAKARIELGRDIQKRCPRAFLSVNGDPEACRALGAPGIHLPSRGFGVGEIRAAFSSALLGVSCHDREDLEAAQGLGADYVFLSPMFDPSSKPCLSPPLGVEGFRKMIAGISIPVLALAGVGPERIGEIAASGAAGAVALGSLFNFFDVESRAREYVDAFQKLDFQPPFPVL